MKKLLFITCLLSISINAQTAGNGFTDIDGNTYSTVIIGNQEWMTTNLRATTYRVGQTIHSIHHQSINSVNNTPNLPQYFKQDNNDINIIDKGFLYNWFAISNADFTQNSQDGWHIPTSSEWFQLFININQYTGLSLTKTDGSITWNCSLTSTNQYNFNLLPTGKVRWNNTFNQIYVSDGYNTGAYFWTTAPNGNNANAITFICPMTANDHNSTNLKYEAMSIRLVRTATLSNNSFEKIKVSIYPNPIQNELHIETGEVVNSVEIFDLLGKQILKSINKNIDVSGLEKGIYLVKINTDNGILTQKIIKR